MGDNIIDRHAEDDADVFVLKWSSIMKLSEIFNEKPERWGFRGDPYFWDYLREKAEYMDIITAQQLQQWISEEYQLLSGKPLTDEYMDFAVIEQFKHGGMSSGGVDNTWWMEEGIPLLIGRLNALTEVSATGCVEVNDIVDK